MFGLHMRTMDLACFVMVAEFSAFKDCDTREGQ